MKNFPLAIKIFFLIILIFGIDPAFAQKVAVVLSGGGSRGAAHIGVLKALEENNIPVDYIAGTSIGAVVGGLYAGGYSPDEIEAIFTSKNFERWTSGELDRKYTYFFKQGEPDASWVSLDVDFRKKLSSFLPTNIITPVEMDFMFMELFAGATAVCRGNFDSLCIPFRCVAADIDSNKAVILGKGSVGKAIRASMTFPFYFKPIKIDDKLMFDGGMYNNFPSDVAVKEFHPDVIIGSKVAGNYPKPEQDDILSQIQNMLMAETDFSLDPENSVLIEPKVEKVNVLDFSHTKAFIDSGYVATMEHINEIKNLIENFTGKQERETKRQNFNNKKPPLIIDSIYTRGLNKRASEYVLKTLSHKSEHITLEKLKAEYFKLLADDKIGFVFPTAKYNEKTGYFDLYLDINPASRYQFKFGGNISTQIANQAFVEFRYKYLFRNALELWGNVYFGRFYSSFLLGGRIDFPSKLPFYLKTDFVYNHYDYFKNSTYFFEDKTPAFIIQEDNHVEIDVGIPVTNNGKLELGAAVTGIEDEYYQTNLFSREDTADKTTFPCFANHLTLEFNTLNRKQYASSGARFLLSLCYINGEENFTSGSLSGNHQANYKTPHQWLSFNLIWDNYFKSIGPVKLGFYSQLYLSGRKLFGNYTSSLLSAPAFDPIPQSKTLFLQGFRAYNFGGVGLKAVLKLGKRFEVRAEGYLFQPYEQILQADDNTAYFGEKFDKRFYIGSGVVVFHSIIGPISLNFNYFDNPGDNFFVSLNIGYLIFNKGVCE